MEQIKRNLENAIYELTSLSTGLTATINSGLLSTAQRQNAETTRTKVEGAIQMARDLLQDLNG